MGRNEKILRELFARYAKDGVEAVLPELDENIVWRTPGAANRLDTAGEWHGHEGTREFYKTARINWTLRSMDVQEVYTADDQRFAARLRVMAKSNTTGKVVQLEKVALVTMENGKITSYSEVFDTAPLERASRL